MRESYVLKRKNGEICGYVMMRNGQLCVKLPDDTGMAQVTVIYEGETQTMEGKLNGMECIYSNGGKHLLGAYVCSKGKVLMDTGKAARIAFEKNEKQRQPVQRRTDLIKNVQEKTTQKEQHEIKADKIRAETERRWPPPPCMPRASYINGAWRISQKEEED